MFRLIQQRTTVFAVALATVFVLVLAMPSVAFAVPSASEVRAAKERLEQLLDEWDFLVQDYLVAQETYAEATAKRAEAEVELAATVERIDELQEQLNTRAVSMYRSGPLGFLDVLLGATTFEEFSATWSLLSDINEAGARAIEELDLLKVEQVQLRGTLTEQEQIAAEAAATAAEKKAAGEASLEAQRATVAGMEAEVAALQVRTVATTPPPPPTAGAPANDYTPPTNAARGDVVSVAMGFIGVPYAWGGSSPAGFDCSGFVQYVFNIVGVSLPRTSYGQMWAGQIVSWGDLQPGDIVVTNGGGHVGIYVGGGSYVHAPYAGQSVRVESVTSFVHGVRP
ncbi:MAG: NlpC/P60 family protein [Coriobacteriia bacterium]|nr:NlpC/P60 family protein [Coriobacteriia bacterium]